MTSCTHQSPASPRPITVARGDGIGPEIMDATLRVLEAAGARLAPEFVEVGEAVYRRGVSSGIDSRAWESLRRTGVFLKAPLTTPGGGGWKSVNVTVRKALGLYANVRPCVSHAPVVGTRHPGMDLVIVRENEEDLYAGIEHRQTDEVVQCLKLVSRPGCERVIRHAFEYAAAHGRRKVTCMTKDNIMKMTDGLFRRVFDEIGAEYPGIEREHQIIDIGAARVAVAPERYDVIVTLNLYGDILSDIAAEVAGSVGMAGSANIGAHAAMFEAVHGSAPDLAGQDAANPSGLLQAAVMMLVHIGQAPVAQRVHDAWLATLEAGLHTADLRGPSTRDVVGTRAFASEVIARLGERPRQLPSRRFVQLPAAAAAPTSHAGAAGGRVAVKELAGVDVFVQARATAQALAERLEQALPGHTRLQMITNRGVKVWPGGLPETLCTDHWRCRVVPAEGAAAGFAPPDVIEVLRRLHQAGLDFIKTEHLYRFDGEPGYALGQGQ